MELSSNVTATWKFCTIGSLLGCFILLLLLHKNYQITNISTATTTSMVQKFAPPVPQTKAMNIIPTASKHSSFSIPSSPPIGRVIAKPKELSNYSSSSTSPSASMVVETWQPSINFTSLSEKQKSKEIYHSHKVEKKCNMFDGRWVYKADAIPSYRVTQCPFIEEKMSCQRNGRPDFDYLKWSWEAKDCIIPLLNGTDMVERFRNKRVVLVGDSLNRNMWESLACILYSSIPNASSKAEIRHDGEFIRTMLKAKEEYNFTIEFFWSPFLVKLNQTHESGKKVLVLDELSPNSELWHGADIMVFNSGHWWPIIGPKKAWEIFEYKGKLIKDMPLHIAYKRAMRTWANWVQKNVNPKKTTLFFRSVSAEHLDKKRGQWCYTKTKPIMNESFKPFFQKSLIRSIEGVIKGMSKSQVRYLNITKLSEYRIDAHPSIYRYKDWKIRAKKDLHNLTTTADCGHWCLPGIPDTWNRLLYASLLLDSFGGASSS